MDRADELRAALSGIATNLEATARHLARLAELVEVAGPPSPQAEPFTQRPLHAGVVWFNTTQAAEYAVRHPATLTKALSAGELHGTQRAKRGRWRIHRDCLDAWLAGAACPHQTAPTPVPRPRRRLPGQSDASWARDRR